jgi:hypothetical protein
MNMDTSSFIASCFWGLFATAFFIYGKRMQEARAMILGAIMFGTCYAANALWMSVICVLSMAGYFYMKKKGL